jgi:hypothetical protein
MEPLETDALLVEFMDPSASAYRTVRTHEDQGAAELPLENNGRVEGRQHVRLRYTASDDDEMLDIVMDGRDAAGLELSDRSHGESGFICIQYSYLGHF